MKIQKVSIELRPKVYGLLQRAFPKSSREADLVRALHEQGRELHEWACIHTGKVIAYLAFSRAYHGREACGLHLAPMAVAPDFQRQGVGSELLRFALRQAAVAARPLYVLGEPAYYARFGFVPCRQPACPFDPGNAHFLTMRGEAAEGFTIGYEPEFSARAAPSPRAGGARRRGR